MVKFAQLLATLGVLVVLVESLPSVCRLPCRCRNGALDCSRATELTSLPDLSTHGFVTLKLRGSGLLDLDCNRLPAKLRLLDVRGTKISPEKTCQLSDCPSVTRIKMSHTCVATSTERTESPAGFYPVSATDTATRDTFFTFTVSTDTTAPFPTQLHTSARGPDPSSTATAHPVAVVACSNVTGTVGVVFALFGVAWGLCNCVFYNMRFRKLRTDFSRQMRATNSELPMQMSELRAPERCSRYDPQSQVQRL